MTSTTQTKTSSIHLNGAREPDSLNVDLTYLQDLPKNKHQPLDFEVEYLFGTKDADTRKLNVSNVRSLNGNGKDDGLDLENAGFQYIGHHSDFLANLRNCGKDVTDNDLVTKEMWVETYGKELESVLRNATPDKKVQHFQVLNHVIRNAPRATDEEKQSAANSDPNAAGTAPPAPRVHIDIANRTSRSKISSMFGEEQEAEWRQEGRRTMFFSFWRPLETVQRDPLGVCDARTFNAKEVVRMNRTFPDLVVQDQPQEVLLVQAAASGETGCKHQWYWMKDQTVDDLLIIKLHDSEGKAEEDFSAPVRSAPHSSFVIPGTEDKPTRKSVEMRAVVIFEE
ncbi:hypothetical protein PRZ48_009082 [Zasmidium cellare]|uniref:Uncharacterized protein n=1 Tax=Zasmidium cellare TaxID=395010 RepID=A0ABR0EHZ2_ZASCE|nr:hypothetical protein PRZ48_009082 [Zasmidium cellare]